MWREDAGKDGQRMGLGMEEGVRASAWQEFSRRRGSWLQLQCPVILVLSNRCVFVLLSRRWLWRWVVTRKTQKESVWGQLKLRMSPATSAPCRYGKPRYCNLVRE